MDAAETLTLVACGSFFLVGLLTGAWKWRWMRVAPDHRAPFYVDTAHRAALLYSFACLVLRAFVAESPWPPAVNLAAAAAPIAFFAIAVLTYIQLGLANRTENQFNDETPLQYWSMVALMVAEIGGFAVLFAGFISRVAG